MLFILGVLLAGWERRIGGCIIKIVLAGNGASSRSDVGLGFGLGDPGIYTYTHAVFSFSTFSFSSFAACSWWGRVLVYKFLGGEGEGCT